MRTWVNSLLTSGGTWTPPKWWNNRSPGYQFKELRQIHREEMFCRTTQMEAHVAVLTKKHTQELNNLKSHSRSELNKLQKELEQLKKKHDEELYHINDEFESSLEKHENRHYDTIEDVKMVLKLEHHELIKTLKQEHLASSENGAASVLASNAIRCAADEIRVEQEVQHKAAMEKQRQRLQLVKFWHHKQNERRSKSLLQKEEKIKLEHHHVIHGLEKEHEQAVRELSKLRKDSEQLKKKHEEELFHINDEFEALLEKHENRHFDTIEDVKMVLKLENDKLIKTLKQEHLVSTANGAASVLASNALSCAAEEIRVEHEVQHKAEMKEQRQRLQLMKSWLYKQNERHRTSLMQKEEQLKLEHHHVIHGLAKEHEQAVWLREERLRQKHHEAIRSLIQEHLADAEDATAALMASNALRCAAGDVSKELKKEHDDEIYRHMQLQGAAVADRETKLKLEHNNLIKGLAVKHLAGTEEAIAEVLSSDALRCAVGDIGEELNKKHEAEFKRHVEAHRKAMEDQEIEIKLRHQDFTQFVECLKKEHYKIMKALKERHLASAEEGAAALLVETAQRCAIEDLNTEKINALSDINTELERIHKEVINTHVDAHRADIADRETKLRLEHHAMVKGLTVKYLAGAEEIKAEVLASNALRCAIGDISADLKKAHKDVIVQSLRADITDRETKLKLEHHRLVKILTNERLACTEEAAAEVLASTALTCAVEETSAELKKKQEAAIARHMQAHRDNMEALDNACRKKMREDRKATRERENKVKLQHLDMIQRLTKKQLADAEEATAALVTLNALRCAVEESFVELKKKQVAIFARHMQAHRTASKNRETKQKIKHHELINALKREHLSSTEDAAAVVLVSTALRCALHDISIDLKQKYEAEVDEKISMHHSAMNEREIQLELKQHKINEERQRLHFAKSWHRKEKERYRRSLKKKEEQLKLEHHGARS